MVPRINGRLPPPLHIDENQEDVRGGEDSINSSMNSSDDSFQEALTREKTDIGRDDRLKMTVLNRRGSPHKKVMVDNSGWWSLANDTSNDMLNKLCIYKNKNVELYKSIFNPKIKINKLILIDRQDQKYIINETFLWYLNICCR